MAAAFLILLLLLEFTFLRFPTSRASSGTGPKANVAIWFGSDGAGWFYLGLGLVYAAIYVWVASQSARSARSWRVGATWGLASGAIWLVVSVITNLLPALNPVRPLALLSVVVSPLVAGTLAARISGLAREGALAGFWCGVVAASLIAVITVAVDNVFANTLIHTSWLHDPTCPQRPGPALAGCEIGDDLGLMAVQLTLLPVVWFGLGAVAGAVATAGAAEASSNGTPPRSPVQAPIVFSGAMLALFLTVMILKLV